MQVEFEVELDTHIVATANVSRWKDSGEYGESDWFYEVELVSVIDKDTGKAFTPDKREIAAIEDAAMTAYDEAR